MEHAGPESGVLEVIEVRAVVSAEDVDLVAGPASYSVFSCVAASNPEICSGDRRFAGRGRGGGAWKHSGMPRVFEGWVVSGLLKVSGALRTPRVSEVQACSLAKSHLGMGSPVLCYLIGGV